LRTLPLLTLAAWLGCATTPAQQRPQSTPAQTAEQAPPPPPSRDPNGPPEQLDKTAIVDGAAKARPVVRECYQRYGVPGVVSVKLKILNDGLPTDVTVLGDLAGTPTGQCVADAVARTASFPRFAGAAQTIIFPFVLR
jgi:hypothetical protein